MSLLYNKLTIIDVDIQKGSTDVNLVFTSDCGKHGTDEILDIYILSPERLLSILQAYDGYEEHEI